MWPEVGRTQDYRVECPIGASIAEVLTRNRHNPSIIAAGSAMPSRSPDTQRRPDFAAWRPSPRTLWWVLLAFAAGLGLFLLVWTGSRGKPDFYRAGDTPPTAAGPDYAPLPVPMPAGSERPREQVEADRGLAGLDPEERPQLVEAPPPPPRPVEPIAKPEPTPTGRVIQPRPIAGRTPAPRYPPAAMRRGESGTVLVRIEVGPDGVPVSTSVANSSGSRLLDRAAVDAARRWRFEPAHVNGQPTVGTVHVPIDFKGN